LNGENVSFFEEHRIKENEETTGLGMAAGTIERGEMASSKMKCG
jgi:hypothetical protein